MRKMRESGVDWIGQIPEVWEIGRLKRIAHLKGGSGFPPALQGKRDGNIRFIKVNALASKIETSRKYDTISEDEALELGAKIFSKGSIVFAKVGAALLMHRFEMLPFDSCIDNNMMGLYSFTCSPKWLQYALTLLDFNALVNPGAVPSVNQSQVGGMPLPLPPLPEQRAIAAYLDEKCAAIDAAIAEAKKGIEDYKAWKKSLIFETVTGKINSDYFDSPANAGGIGRRSVSEASEKSEFQNRPMKPSGIPWIGDIPEGWKVARLKSLFSYGKGLAITKADLVPKGIPVISYGQIHAKINSGTHLQDDLLRCVSAGYLQTDSDCLLKRNDFVFADTSEDLEGLGNCAFVDRGDKIFAGYHTIVFRPKCDMPSKYLAYLFKTDCWRSQFRAKAYGIKVYSLSQRLLNDCSVILPPEREAGRIADYLDEKCAAIDALVAEKESLISDLEAYKKSLIYETVTGKRDLGRLGAAAPSTGQRAPSKRQ